MSHSERTQRVELVQSNKQHQTSKKDQSRTRGPSGKRGEIKEAILSQARRAFLSKGYDQVTLREIARGARCDPAMIPYYFGTKEQLFRQCLNLPADPAQQVLKLILEDPSTAGRRVAQFTFDMYEERITAETMLALMRALITDVATSDRFRNYIRNDVLSKVAQTLGADRSAEELVELTLAQMYGVVVMRYAVRLEPLASMPRESLIEQIAPLIQEGLDALIAAARARPERETQT